MTVTDLKVKVIYPQYHNDLPIGIALWLCQQTIQSLRQLIVTQKARTIIYIKQQWNKTSELLY